MYTIAVCGATGAVGRKIVEIIEEYNLPVKELRLLASARSKGKSVPFRQQQLIIEELTAEQLTADIDFALFAAGGAISEKFAPIAAQNGIIVIDNSSIFRMDTDIPLVVPEINPQAIDLTANKIIANPNCSTIQSVLPLAAIQKIANLTRVDYITYQAVSGAGQNGITDLERGEKGLAPAQFDYSIYNNVIPQIDVFLENGYTKEEVKMITETQKILNLPTLPISATCVRVPVKNSHSVDISFTVDKKISLLEIRDILEKSPGITVVDDPHTLKYPMPLDASGFDEVFVGRIRQDLYNPLQFHMFVVADNLRKGAASNAVQIMRYLMEHATSTK
ncbi:semialdehyde dehydrogenase [Erysipelotrichaceae bacterium]|nr:semialdehyde dehydrogenase [Erysipelotrichaceae bacterium]